MFNFVADWRLRDYLLDVPAGIYMSKRLKNIATPLAIARFKEGGVLGYRYCKSAVSFSSVFIWILGTIKAAQRAFPIVGSGRHCRGLSTGSSPEI